MTQPNPNTLYPLNGYERLCFLKNVVKNPNIIVGDYTYYDDFETVENFEKNVKYHFDFTGDKLIIGKFCMIASGAEFIMNGANHLVDSLTSYPFAIFSGDWAGAMAGKTYPNKGNIVIGNDVWIGYQATILSGVKVGDGAIIGSKSVVANDVPPYSIVAGNPARVIRKRFDEATIQRLLSLRWWDWEMDKITQSAVLLTGNNVAALEQILEDEEDRLETQPSNLPKIKLTREQIKEFFEELDMGNKCYYHFPTGTIVSYFDDIEGVMDDETAEEVEKIEADIEENGDDYFEFQKMTSRESFSIMEDFIETISDKRLADRLAHAISKSKPFRHFKDIVDDSSYRDKWFRFRDERGIDWIEQQISDYNEQF
jgi:virginiamycin A acetyltransferase